MFKVKGNGCVVLNYWKTAVFVATIAKNKINKIIL